MEFEKVLIEFPFVLSMRIGDLLFVLAAAHIPVHHLADDGAGADDGNLHYEVVEARGRVVRYGCHLRTARRREG